MAKNLSLGRNPSPNLRYDIENFLDTAEKCDAPAAAKRCDSARLSMSRSPSPLSKKSDFIVNKCVTEPDAVPAMDVDSGPSSIIMPLTDVSPTNGNGPNASANSNHSINLHTVASPFDNNCSHSSCSFSRNETLIDQVPSSTNHQTNTAVATAATVARTECSPFIREIPKSPHLSKDFSPNGERLRNSLRFRRQERLQKQRSLRTLANLISQQSSSSWESGNDNSISSATNSTDEFDCDRTLNIFNFPKLPHTDTTNAKPFGKKSKPYGEKGFIIQVNDGSLTLSDVKDLNNCYSDDFDSSCDTSLNYIDPDSLNATIENETSSKIVETTVIPPKSLKNSTFEIAIIENDEPIEGKMTFGLDEVCANLNKCRSKLGALEIGDTRVKKSAKSKAKPVKNVSLNSVLSPPHPSKKDPFEVVVTKSTNVSVFTRLHPVSSPILNSRSSKQKSVVIDPSKKPPPKRNDTQNGVANKVPSKNYSKNTLAFIEKINDGLNERHQKTGQSDNKKNGGKKNTTTTTLAQDVLTRKPPAPTAPKKFLASTRNGDKPIKSNSHLSPTRKRL